MSSATNNENLDMNNDRISRREALRTAGVLAGGALLGGSLLVRGKQALADGDMMAQGDMAMMPPSTAPVVFGDLVNFRTDVDILNFALLLEYLESDFYTRAVQAQSAHAFLKDRTSTLALKLRDDENAHVIAVSQRIQELGGTPVAKPAFQFPSETFTSEFAFLNFATTLEETGVHAYLGAAPSVQNKGVLRFAASIYGIEARHTSMIRLLSGRLSAPNALETPLSGPVIASMASPYFITPAA